jgi:hypothetical protein
VLQVLAPLQALLLLVLHLLKVEQETIEKAWFPQMVNGIQLFLI